MTAELPQTSEDVATGCRGNSRVSAASVTAHGTSTESARVVATARAAGLSVANSVVQSMATHGSPRQLPRKFTRKFPRKLPLQFPRPSAVISTATRQSRRKSDDVRGNCHGGFRGRPTEAISTAIGGRPRPLPRQSSDMRQLPRKPAAVATARAAVLSVANSVVPTMPTEVPGNTHHRFRGICVRQSGTTPQ